MCGKESASIGMAGPFAGPLLSNRPNDMPAVWRLFSIGVALVSLNPVISDKLFGSSRNSYA